MATRTAAVKDLEDAFVKVTFEDEINASQSKGSAIDPFYNDWVDQGAPDVIPGCSHPDSISSIGSVQ